MILFLDFDNLLIDTRSWIKKDLLDIFVQNGVTEEMILNTAKYFAGAHSDNKPQYTPRRHFDALQVDPSLYFGFKESIDKAISCIDQYLFPDTLPFLKTFKADKLILLTYGDRTFQSSKIRSSGIEQYFHDVLIVDSDKLDTINDWTMNVDCKERVYFLDDKASYFDRAVEFPKIVGVHVLRGTEQCVQPMSHHDIHDLTEAVAFIKHN